MYVNQQAGGKAFPLFDDRSSLLVLPAWKQKKSRLQDGITENGSLFQPINKYHLKSLLNILFFSYNITRYRYYSLLIHYTAIRQKWQWFLPCRTRIFSPVVVVLGFCDRFRNSTSVQIDRVGNVLRR